MSEEIADVSDEIQDSSPVEEEATTSTDEESTPETSDQSEVSSDEAEEEAEPTEEGGEEPEVGSKEYNFRQLEQKARDAEAKLADLEAKFEQDRKANQTARAVDVQALNTHLAQMQDTIDDYRIEGKHLEAEKLVRQRNALIDEYDAFTAEQGKLEQQQQATQKEQEHRRSMLQGFDEASVFLAQQKGIPDNVFADMGQTFREVVESDKLFARKFVETLERQGPVHAATLAHDRVVEAIDAKQAKATEAKAKKDAAKGKQVAGGGAEASGTVKSYQALLNLGSAQVASYKTQNPKHYQKLLDKHMEA